VQAGAPLQVQVPPVQVSVVPLQVVQQVVVETQPLPQSFCPELQLQLPLLHTLSAPQGEAPRVPQTHPPPVQVSLSTLQGFPAALQVQVPPAQVSVGPVQALQQVELLTQVPLPQSFWPLGQTHRPPVQVLPPVHAMAPLQVQVPPVQVSVVPVQALQQVELLTQVPVPQSFLPAGQTHVLPVQVLPPVQGAALPQAQLPAAEQESVMPPVQSTTLQHLPAAMHLVPATQTVSPAEHLQR
jgi:hypothetical protein